MPAMWEGGEGMTKQRLNGYWVDKIDPDVTIFVEKVFKAGHVTGFKYTKTPKGTVHSELKISHEELQRVYEREGE